MEKILLVNLMNNKEYDDLIKNTCPKDNMFRNVFVAFVSGGLIGLLGEIITHICTSCFNTNISDAYLLTFCFFVVVGSILTGLGVFDKVLSICKCGLIVPSTGFANTMTSSAMDAKSEGFVKGIGGSIFKLTGSIILYGVIFGIIFGYINGVLS